MNSPNTINELQEIIKKALELTWNELMNLSAPEILQMSIQRRKGLNKDIQHVLVILSDLKRITELQVLESKYYSATSSLSLHLEAIDD